MGGGDDATKKSASLMRSGSDPGILRRAENGGDKSRSRLEIEPTSSETLYLGRVSEMQEQMLEKKTQEFCLPEGTRKEQGFGRRAWMGALAAALLTVATGAATAQSSSSSTQLSTNPQATTTTRPKTKIGFI